MYASLCGVALLVFVVYQVAAKRLGGAQLRRRVSSSPA
jgi:hypothetical protein